MNFICVAIGTFQSVGLILKSRKTNYGIYCLIKK